MMNKTMLLSLLFIGCVYSQSNSGFVRFEGDEAWIIRINDSLTVQTDSLATLPVGFHKFKARPQISYSWPAILIEGQIEIQQDDTLTYLLNIENSLVQDEPTQKLPKVIQYSGKGYQPSIKRHTKIKTGLILSALASSWVSFYLKRRADDYYADYRSASNLSKINNFYDKSQQFDTYSSIMLGISAAALSSYIYLSLTE